MVRQLCRIVLYMLLVSIAVVSSIHKAHAEVNDDYALKISLENQLERKLKQVIMEITGTDRVVIFVNAELASARGDSDKMLESRKTNALVLPGVPQKKEFGAGQSEVLFGAGSSKYKVNKITLSIWIDKSVPGSIVDLIQDIAKNVIGYNQNRGDVIDVKKVDFESKGFFRTLFAMPNFLLLILTVVGGFTMVTVGMFFMDPLKKIVPALEAVDWKKMRGEAIAAPAAVDRTTIYEREVLAGKSETTAQTASSAEAGLPFSFVRERDLPGLAYLLKDRSAQDVAIVANYLDPSLSMRLLERFPKEKQVEIALVLGREDVSAEKVSALEEFVKTKLVYVVGGENKLVTLLDMSSDDMREKIVKTIESKDAAAAIRLKQKVRSLETIIRDLTAQGIQTLFRNVDAAAFAQILKSEPSETQQKVITSLSAGAAERLKEEMELSRSLSAVRLRREKQNLMVVVRRLISEGLVEVENN